MLSPAVETMLPEASSTRTVTEGLKGSPAVVFVGLTAKASLAGVPPEMLNGLLVAAVTPAAVASSV